MAKENISPHKNKKPIIAGIDPGTTTAYAFLDLNGNLLCLESKKNLSLSNLLRNILSTGSVAIIGTDVKNPPKLTKKISTILKAKIISPEENLATQQKIKIIRKFEKDLKKSPNAKTAKTEWRYNRLIFNNKHEKDALAAAILAYKKIKPLLKKIDDGLKFLPEPTRENIKAKVLKESIAISKIIKERKEENKEENASA